MAAALAVCLYCTDKIMLYPHGIFNVRSGFCTKPSVPTQAACRLLAKSVRLRRHSVPCKWAENGQQRVVWFPV